MLRHKLLPLFLLLNLSVIAGARTDNPPDAAAVTSLLPRLEEYIESGMKKTGVPGLAIGIVYRDQVIYLKGFGVRKAGGRARVNEDTIFQLASVSKPIASTIIASLVSTGTVNFDDRIAELDPEFKLSNPSVTEQVTIRDFLSHRSGLKGASGDNLEDLGYSRPEILHRLRFLPLPGEFRRSYAYTNFGYTEGAIAAAKRAESRWEDLAVERLYRPLGMTSTSSRFSDYFNAKNKAFGHVFENGKAVNRYLREPDSEAPAGGVSSSVRDLAQWVRLQLSNGQWNGEQIVDADALAETHKPEIVIDPKAGLYYGMGWDVNSDQRGKTILSHSGAFSLGAGTTVLLSPSDQLGIVVLTNALPVGLAEAASRVFLDYVVYGHATRDWLPLYSGLFQEMLNGLNNSSTDYSKLTPPNPPAPPQALSSYAGTYHNDYYGNLEITRTGDHLLLHLPPRGATYYLKHWSGNTFVYRFAGETGIGTRGVVFSGSSASRVLVENLATEDSGVFTRVSD